MSTVGQIERITQNRVINLFRQLGYTYLGNWETRDNNRNIETTLLSQWLQQQGVSDILINKSLQKLDLDAALGEGQNLYNANKEVYRLLRYGVKEKEGAGQQNQTVWLIDWKHPENNHFAIAEEVTSKAKTKSALISCSTSTASPSAFWNSNAPVWRSRKVFARTSTTKRKPSFAPSSPQCNW